MKAKIIFISPVSCSIEIENEKPYYNEEKYDIFLDNELVISQESKNIFSLFNLTPNTFYIITIRKEKEKAYLEFVTERVSEIVSVNNSNSFNEIEKKMNNLKNNGMIIFEKGVYDIKPIFLKDDTTIYLKKGSYLRNSINREDYKVLDEYKDGLPYGTWEGNTNKMYASTITGFKNKNIKIVGEGTLDGNGQNGDWWINPKQIKVATRPRMIFLNHCENIAIQGISIINSPCWTIHPYYSNKVSFINLNVINPKNSPNTDGCNPESSSNVKILGCHFSVGDDCIAIKSGKIEMVKDYYKPSDNITIRNCMMEDGHGAIVLGSEMSCGITNLDVKQCLFVNTDRGLRIKTRRGRGNKAFISDITFENIVMKNVLNNFVINMFYKCDSDGCNDYVQSKEYHEVDDKTPYLGKFKFKDIKCFDTLVSAGYFYGLPEQKIEEIEFENVIVNMIESTVKMYPALMCGIDEENRLGCYFNNVNKVVINSLEINNPKGEKIILNNVNEFINKKEG